MGMAWKRTASTHRAAHAPAVGGPFIGGDEWTRVFDKGGSDSKHEGGASFFQTKNDSLLRLLAPLLSEDEVE